MENFKSRSERPKGAGCSLLPPSGINHYPTPSGYFSLIHPASDRMQFGNYTLRLSWEAAVAGSGLRQSLGSIPQNRPLEKSDEGGRGDLGG